MLRNWVLPDPSHKVDHVHQCSGTNQSGFYEVSQSSHWKHSKLHEVAQVSIVLTSTLPFGLMRNLLRSADKEEKIQAWFMYTSVWYTGITACQLFSKTSVKGMKRNPPSGQKFEWCTSLFTLFRRRNGQIWNCKPIHRIWPMVGLQGQGFRKNKIKKWWWWNLGKRYVDKLFWMVKGMKIFMPHINVHQRVTSEEGFNNQLERMTCIVDTSHPLSPAILSLPSGFMTWH